MRIRFDTHVLQLFLSDLFKYVGGEFFNVFFHDCFQIIRIYKLQ